MEVPILVSIMSVLAVVAIYFTWGRKAKATDTPAIEAKQAP